MTSINFICRRPQVNYLLVVASVVAAAFLRRPWALPAVAAAAAALAVQNDTFAASLSEAALRAVRRVNDRAASRLRRAAGGDAAGGLGCATHCSLSQFSVSHFSVSHVWQAAPCFDRARCNLSSTAALKAARREAHQLTPPASIRSCRSPHHNSHHMRVLSRRKPDVDLASHLFAL